MSSLRYNKILARCESVGGAAKDYVPHDEEAQNWRKIGAFYYATPPPQKKNGSCGEDNDKGEDYRAIVRSMNKMLTSLVEK